MKKTLTSSSGFLYVQSDRKHFGIKKDRKGIFFTITVIAIMSLFLIGYTFYKNFADRSVTHERISTLNTFIFSIEENIERQLFISGFRTLFIMQTESVEQGQYIQNATSSFNELFFNGNFNGVAQPIMIGATFTDIQSEIQQKANKVNANIELTNPTIYLTQSDPWNVDVVLTVNLGAQDKGKLVTWNKTKTYVSKISVKDFEDPLYLINTAGIVTNKILSTPFSNFTIANLNNHTSSKYYKSSTQAPSYLNRLQGISSADTNGIESLVYIPQLSNQGITIQDKSIVDYIYFSSINPVKCQITGMPSWFKIDQSHLTDYQLNGLEHSCN